MKKLSIFVLTALLFAGCLPSLTAFAEAEAESYARVTQEGVYFYRYADESAGLFILPRTYFVKITGEAGNFYKVSYGDAGAALEGYCKASEVTPVNYIPETPYLSYTVTVTFRADSGGMDLPDSFFTEYEAEAAYYGEFMYGSATCYYVNMEGQFGYVPAAACSAVNYPENTEHPEEETPPAEEEPAAEQSFGALNVVLICVLAVAALGALYFLFRPSKARRTEPAAYDETEDVF